MGQKERVISIRIMNKLESNKQLTSDLGITCQIKHNDLCNGKGDEYDYSNISACNSDSGFVVSI